MIEMFVCALRRLMVDGLWVALSSSSGVSNITCASADLGFQLEKTPKISQSSLTRFSPTCLIHCLDSLVCLASWQPDNLATWLFAGTQLLSLKLRLSYLLLLLNLIAFDLD